MRFLFLIFGVPMMIMSFFQVSDVLPLAENVQLLQEGKQIVLSQENQIELRSQVEALFNDSRTMPALSVVFGDEFNEILQNGTFVSVKFDKTFQINDLPFDELIFQVTPESFGFNVFRGNSDIVQGRCIYVDLNGKTTKQFYDFVSTLIEGNMAEESLSETSPINPIV